MIDRPGIRAALLAWYRDHGRDLPWRHTRDPYGVWVSEVMLQQTRVATVIPFWLEFVARFPNVAALAAAAEHEVVAAWSGLGYYRRARALHAGAREVMERHGGAVPSDPGTLREIPGIGRYTAGAIASIAFDRQEPVLDGNVRRVLTRVAGGLEEHPGAAARERALWDLSADLARGSRPGDLNQALMELGATVCRPRAPLCGDCPVAAYCAASASGHPERWPAPRSRRATSEVAVAVALVRRGGRVLVVARHERSPLRGDWDLPAVETSTPEHAAPELRAKLAAFGLTVDLVTTSANLRHAILDRILRLRVFEGRKVRGRISSGDAACWADAEQLRRSVPISGATRKVLRAAGWNPDRG